MECVFGVLSGEVDKLGDLVVCDDVCEVGVESRSMYWIGIWNILCVEFSVKVVNGYLMKEVGGGKSEVKDGEWIGRVVEKGLIGGS